MALKAEFFPEQTDAMSDARLARELSVLLSNAFYSNSSTMSVGKFLSRPENCNANFSVIAAQTMRQIFYDVLEAVSKTSCSPYINIILNAPPHLSTKEEFSFVQDIPLLEQRSRALMMHQTINLHAFEAHIDLYCARLCQFFGNTAPVYYQLYQTNDRSENDNQFIVVEDGLLYYYLKNPYSGQAYSMFSRDRDLVFDFYTSTEANLKQRPLLTSYFDSDWLIQRKIIYRYIMSGRLSVLLNTMQPILMGKELFSSLCGRLSERPQGHQTNNQYFMLWEAPKQIILYKSALVSYMYEGTINLCGTLQHIEEETRREHLSQLCEKLSTLNSDDSTSLIILNDDNPLLNSNDCGAPVFLSDGIAFMENLSSDSAHRFIRIRSLEIIGYYYRFFEHLAQLDDIYVLKGNQVVDFISRGINMI